jgi:hypothetical protein
VDILTNILFGAVGLIAFGLVLRRFVEWIGAPCQFCGSKTNRFRRLDSATQANILDYFVQHERREPDRSGLFICLNCRTVHDDFSGEKGSWDVDTFGCVTFCKVCLARIRGCEPEREVECPQCETKYSWTIHDGSGFRFLMPPRGITIGKRPTSFMMDSR